MVRRLKAFNAGRRKHEQAGELPWDDVLSRGRAGASTSPGSLQKVQLAPRAESPTAAAVGLPPRLSSPLSEGSLEAGCHLTEMM